MVIKNIFLLGTSRLHRPFCKAVGNKIINNINPNIAVNFGHLGYFHSIHEIVQIINWINGDLYIPPELGQFIFRKEPEQTTPLNVFSAQLERAILNGLSLPPPLLNLSSIDAFVFEISSMISFLHPGSGIYLHLNPNLSPDLKNAKDIKWGEWINFVDIKSIKIELYDNILKNLFFRLVKIVPAHKIIIIGHLAGKSAPNETRLKLNSMLQTMCDLFNMTYFDTSRYLDTFGFNSNNGKVDIFHLTHEGEMTFGHDIQQLVLSKS